MENATVEKMVKITLILLIIKQKQSITTKPTKKKIQKTMQEDYRNLSEDEKTFKEIMPTMKIKV